MRATLSTGGRRPQQWEGNVTAINFQERAVSFLHDECFFDEHAEDCRCLKPILLRFDPYVEEEDKRWFSSDWESYMALYVRRADGASTA